MKKNKKQRERNETTKGFKFALGVVLFLVIFFWFFRPHLVVQPIDSDGNIIAPTETKDDGIYSSVPLQRGVGSEEGTPIVQPTKPSYSESRNGVTLTVTDYTFEKRTETYGKLKEIEFQLYNYQGSKPIIPSILVVITDKKDRTLTIKKQIDLGEWLENGDTIHKRIIVDLGVGGIQNQKELGVHVLDWGRIITSVRFDTNLTEGFK